ncbi:putative oxidoreductase YfjR [Hypsizygus marmoreus]|uniref:Oxidoreductase YfjR n=1 Tax=Hypsizygus marmoreus TaxID=39966 RepID=A0A369K0W1_HYPMA|nr:putative oxidoreductase YfjR [Hypsizygus marmoreus]
MSTQLVGFVGLGALGTHMARNLALHRATAGLSPLLIWNRTVAKSQKLAEDLGLNKVRVAETLEDLATECDVVITNLANDAVSKDVYGVFVKAVKASAPKSRIFVETSTIHPSFATELKTLITALPSTQFVASPVFGSPPVAEKAQLILLMSGEPEPVKEISSILCPAVGAKVLEMGEDIEKAPTLKLIGNSFILGSLEILAECQTLAEKTGLGAQGAQNLAKIFYTPPLCAYGDKMLNHAFDGSQGFSLNGGIKDATHVQSLAKTHGTPMPALEAARVHLVKAREIHEREIAVGKSGVGVLDVASLVTAVREEAGVAKNH